VRLILDRGGDPNFESTEAPTPLMAAAQAGATDVLCLLIQRGADLNARGSARCNPFSWTAFHFACSSQYANDVERGTPSKNNTFAKCVEELLRAGCDTTIVDVHGRTGRQIAEIQGTAEVRACLASHAKKEKKNRKRREQRKRARAAGGTGPLSVTAQPEPETVELASATEPDLEPRESEPFQTLQNSESRDKPTPAPLSMQTNDQEQPWQTIQEAQYAFERIKTLTVIRDGYVELNKMRVAEAELAEWEPELEPEIDLDATQAPEPEPSVERAALTGPMAEFDEPEVRRWLGTVDGLTAEELASVRATLADEEEYDGQELLSTTPKSFRRLLRGTGAEAAVPLLLAARDAFVEACVHRDDPTPPPPPPPSPVR
jgi:hypothetical protein